MTTKEHTIKFRPDYPFFYGWKLTICNLVMWLYVGVSINLGMIYMLPVLVSVGWYILLVIIERQSIRYRNAYRLEYQRTLKLLEAIEGHNRKVADFHMEKATEDTGKEGKKDEE